MAGRAHLVPRRPRSGEGRDGHARQESHPGDREVQDERSDENDEGQEVVPPARHRPSDFGQLSGRKPLKATGGRDQVDEDEDRADVEDRRHQSRSDDLEVGDPGVFGDEKRSRSHDRRQDLAPRAGGRFDPSRFGRLVPDAFHQGDRERPARHDVRDRAAGYRSHGGGRHDRGLGWPPRLSSREGIGQIHEELTGTGHLEQGSEEDEDEDERGRDSQRDPVDPLLSQV